jgi:drug/metabolite transporter (DMT)-like permease
LGYDVVEAESGSLGMAEGRVTDAKSRLLAHVRRRARFSGANVSYPLLAASKVQQSSHSNFVRGALYGLSAVSIWAAFIVVSRLGVRTSLTPWDVAAIRFGTAGVLLLPYLVQKGLALDRLGWIGLVAISIGCGAPMVLLVNAGLLFAPAAHGGALFPGVMPLIVAMLAAIILKEAATPQKNVGLVLIVLGAVMIVCATGGTLGTRQNIGHVLFLCAGLAWAGYTVAMRHARLDGLHAAAIAAVASLVFYVPIYAALSRGSLFNAPVADVALQSVVQGILTAIVALLLYGRMVSILGATAGAGFVALTPATTALLAIPVLGEWPSVTDWLAITVISVGVYILSGGPLPRAPGPKKPLENT